jgi:hypothetical protein
MTNKRMLIYFVNSLLIFLATYIITYYIYQISTALMAKSFNIGSTISFKELKFNVDNDSNAWLPRNLVVTSVTFVGPLFNLLIGVVILSFLRIRRVDFKPIVLMFLMWFAFHNIARFFAGFISGCIELDEIWIGYTYLDLNDVFYYIFGAFNMLILVLTGLLFFDVFMLTSGSATIRNFAGGVYLTFAGFFPWLLGTGVIYLLHLPEVFKFEIWILLLMGIIPISQNIGRWMFRERGMHLKLHKGHEKIAWGWMIFCLLIVLLYAFNISERLS